jgi:hypothetical protein
MVTGVAPARGPLRLRLPAVPGTIFSAAGVKKGTVTLQVLVVATAGSRSTQQAVALTVTRP